MFNTNEKGGWIIPAETAVAPGTHIPNYSEIGNYCKIGDGCEIGDDCEIGDGCEISNGCKVGNVCKIGDGCEIGNYCKIGNGCKVGNVCKIGDDCEIGNYCKIGNYCEIGDGCKIGDGCIWLGVEAKSWLTLANIDGSGRQIKVVRGVDDEIKIEAGCFQGALAEFIDRAKAEGKLRYVSIISAIAEHV